MLYACQDLEVDRRQHLKSIPVRFGVARSLWISRAMHVGHDRVPRALGVLAGLGAVYFFGVAAVAGLLAYEQSLVSETDLSNVKLAFDLNGYVGILYFRGHRHFRVCRPSNQSLIPNPHPWLLQRRNRLVLPACSTRLPIATTF